MARTTRKTKTTKAKTRKAKTQSTRKPTRKAAPKQARRKPVGTRRADAAIPLFAPMTGTERRTVGRVRLDVGRAGAARVKRMIYPPGFRWSADLKPIVGTDLCVHAHVGFLAHGEIHIEYADGCVVEYKAPQVIAIDPGHDGWVVGKEPVVLIEFDFERETVERMGMPGTHRHD